MGSLFCKNNGIMQASCIILLLFVNLIFRKDMNNINLKMTIIPSVAKVKQVVLFLSVSCVLSCNRYVADWGDASGQEEKEVFSPTLNIPDISGTEIPLYTILRTSESYGLESNATKDQSSAFQSAIDDLSSKGGGGLLISKGTYCLNNVYMKSDVHIMVEKDVVFKPVLSGNKSIMFIFSTVDETVDGYISNVSISGVGGERFTVDFTGFHPDNDYSCESSSTAPSLRFIRCCMVKNFLISDFNVLDNYTKHSAIELNCANVDVEGWELSRPTDGLVENCYIDKADWGYGLVQAHAAHNVLFRDISGVGGVTLRFETGYGKNIGLFDVYGYNVSVSDGRSAVLLSPHVSHNGKVLVEKVTGINTALTVSIEEGFDDERDPSKEGIKGSFSDESVIYDIYAEYGEKSQIRIPDIYLYEPEYYPLFKKEVIGESARQYTGPSIAPAFDGSNKTYSVKIENIKSKGFKYHSDKILYEEDIERERSDSWKIYRTLPFYYE